MSVKKGPLNFSSLVVSGTTENANFIRQHWNCVLQHLQSSDSHCFFLNEGLFSVLLCIKAKMAASNLFFFSPLGALFFVIRYNR